MIQEIINIIEHEANQLPSHERLAVLTQTKEIALTELENEMAWSQLIKLCEYPH